jgi:glycerol-3-phosphate O-acyltransferase
LTLEAVVVNHVVTRFDGGPESVCQIGAKQQLNASYYCNTIIHFFVNTAIAELALLRAAEGGSGDPIQIFWNEAMRLRVLWKFEFFFANKEIYQEEIRGKLDLQTPEWEKELGEGGDGIQRLIQNFRPFTSHRRGRCPSVRSRPLGQT